MSSEGYFDWLVSKINTVDIYGRSYKKLIRIMYDFEFVAYVDYDDNRIGDVLSMRDKYRYGPIDREFVSVFEILITLAEHMDFFLYNVEDPEERVGEYFWELVTNLRLQFYSDDIIKQDTDAKWEILEILDAFVERKYSENDQKGCVFSSSGQKKWPRGHFLAELWYQLMAYL